MPNRLALASSAPKVTHDPTVTIQGDPLAFIADPFLMTEEVIFGSVNTLLTWIDDATGLDLEGIVAPLEGLVGGSTGLLSGLLGWLTPGSTTTTPNVLSPITSLLGAGNLLGLPVAIGQLGLNAILSLLNLGGTGTSTGTGSSSTDPLGGLLGLISTVPLDLLSLLLGTNASQQAQIDAINSGGFTYDPAMTGVTGWTTLTPTALALSSRGPFIQPEVQTVAYRSSTLALENYGVSFVIDPTMRGVAGYAICVDTAGANWVGLLVYRGFDGDALWLVSGDTPTLWAIVKEFDLTDTNRLSGLTTCKLKTDGVNKFWAEINGHPVTWNDGEKVWTDSGALATHNSTHRGVLLLANMLDNHVDSNYGPAFKGKANSYAA